MFAVLYCFLTHPFHPSTLYSETTLIKGHLWAERSDVFLKNFQCIYLFISNQMGMRDPCPSDKVDMGVKTATHAYLVTGKRIPEVLF
jgi:hypothetical protein